MSGRLMAAWRALLGVPQRGGLKTAEVDLIAAAVGTHRAMHTMMPALGLGGEDNPLPQEALEFIMAAAQLDNALAAYYATTKVPS